jgi:hypothetical protein
MSGNNDDTWQVWSRLAYITVIPAFLIVVTMLTVVWVHRASTYASQESDSASSAVDPSVTE